MIFLSRDMRRVLVYKLCSAFRSVYPRSGLAGFSLYIFCLITVHASADQPNVLFIVVDDLRPELGCYGASHISSPNMDQLASQGVLFERAYCQQAVCNPSRSSLLTGMRPNSIGITTNHAHFRDRHPDVVTIPEYFRHHGYQSHGIGKIFHGVFPKGTSKTVWDTMGDPQSWSSQPIRFGPRYYFTEKGIASARFAYQTMYKNEDPDDDDWQRKLVFGIATESPDVPDDVLYDGKVTKAAIQQLRQFEKNPDEPFFLAVGFIKPHSPYIAPKKYFDRYSSDKISLAQNINLPKRAPAFAGHRSGELRRYTDQPNRGPFKPSNQRRVRHAYFACISFIDAQIGRILNELDQLGLTKNTAICLFGDHGYHLGEHGLWGKTTNFELDTRVPLFIRIPGMDTGGRKIKTPVELLDIFPTLVEIAGLPTPRQLEGQSLLPLIQNPNRTIKTAACSQFPRGKRMGYSIRTDRHRLTLWISQTTNQVEATELYDYADGLIETENMAAQAEYTNVVDQLTAQMSDIMQLSIADDKTQSNRKARQPSSPAFSLARPFTDHMVLQSDCPIRVWGRAPPGQAVRVEFAGATAEATSGQAGNWSLKLAKQSATNQPAKLIARCGNQSITVKDVLVGEVWICAGQSNMEWPLVKSAGGRRALTNATDKELRLLNMPGRARGSAGIYDQTQLARLTYESFSAGNWQAADSGTAKNFSAVAYFFGNRLRKELKRPVGLINISIGGTPTEAWTPRGALQSHPRLHLMIRGNWLENPQLDDWCKRRARQNLQRGLNGELEMRGDQWGPNHSFKPGFMYETSVRPLTPMSLRGVIWYQGESNAASKKRIAQYQEIFPLMVKSWRQAFQDNDQPWGIVQLPAMGRANWPLFREVQRRHSDGIKNVGMAVTMDVGHATDVHPVQKQIVGERLAAWALADVYDRGGVVTGPAYKTHRVEGNRLIVDFDSIGDRMTTRDGQPPRHFELAGNNQFFFAANAEIQGDSVVLSSPNVKNPVHLRYAWKPFPDPPVNLENTFGTSAVPFTTVENLELPDWYDVKN